MGVKEDAMVDAPVTPKVISGRFWLSFLLTAAVSSLMPLSQTSDGGTVTRVHLYDVYLRLFQSPTPEGGSLPDTLIKIAVHLAVCFVVAYGIRRAIFRSVEKARRDMLTSGEE
jgi:hypothetical protein